MPKADETAIIVVDGQKFGDWTTVHVSTDFKQAVRVFSVGVVERTGGKLVSKTKQIMPGKKVQVFLAGEKIAEAAVWQRQVSFNATTHGVLIVGRSMTGDLVDSSAPMKTSQYRNYAFQPIAEKLLQPFGVKLIMQNAPAAASKTFKDVSFIPGESVYAVVERLARMRGMFVTDDADGNLVVGHATKNMQGDLVEGRNIIEANFLLQDDRYSNLSVIGQDRGDDGTNGDKARQPAAFVQGGSDVRYRPLLIASEQPGDSVDMKHRAEHDANHYLDQKVEIAVKVQGWKAPNGKLWKAGEQTLIRSPMMPIAQAMAIQSAEFHQDQSGTHTSLMLVMPNRLGSFSAPSARANPDADPLPGGDPKTAVPQET